VVVGIMKTKGAASGAPTNQCCVFSVGFAQLDSLVFAQPPHPPQAADFLVEGTIQRRTKKITAEITQIPTISSCHIMISPVYRLTHNGAGDLVSRPSGKVSKRK
jgi:hypothetical protein